VSTSLTAIPQRSSRLHPHAPQPLNVAPRATNRPGGRILAGTRPDDHDRMIWHTVPMPIALAGLPGTGKTFIARILHIDTRTYLADTHAGIKYARFS
jgi:hypothetical protein